MHVTHDLWKCSLVDIAQAAGQQGALGQTWGPPRGSSSPSPWPSEARWVRVGSPVSAGPVWCSVPRKV